MSKSVIVCKCYFKTNTMTHEALSQAQKDAHLDQQRLSDAALIIGGARHREGRLHVTDEQMEGFTEENSRRAAPAAGSALARPVGDRALRLASPHSVAEEMALKTTADWETEVVRSDEVTHLIAAVTTPYYTMFASQLPSLDQVDRGMFGGIKFAYKDIEQQVERTVGHREISYKVNTRYLQDKKGVALQSSTVYAQPVVSNSHPLSRYQDSSYEAYTRASIGRGHIFRVDCELPHSGEGFAGTDLITGMPQGLQRNHTFKFDLEGAEPSVIATAFDKKHSEYAYIYAPEENVFKLRTDRLDIPASVSKELSTSEYLQALEAALSLFPTEEILA